MTRTALALALALALLPSLALAEQAWVRNRPMGRGEIVQTERHRSGLTCSDVRRHVAERGRAGAENLARQFGATSADLAQARTCLVRTRRSR